MRAFLFLALAGLATLPAHADLTWTLNGVTLADGGTASGFFTFNSGGTFNWSIAMSGGNTIQFPDFTYNSADSTVLLAFSDQILLKGPTEMITPPGSLNPEPLPRELHLYLATPSPDIGPSTIALLMGPSGLISSECFDCNPSRFINAGSVDVTGSIGAFPVPIPAGVPEPAPIGLAAIGILAFSGLRARLRRQSS